MEQAPRVGVLQPLGQPGGDPGRGPDEARPRGGTAGPAGPGRARRPAAGGPPRSTATTRGSGRRIDRSGRGRAAAAGRRRPRPGRRPGAAPRPAARPARSAVARGRAGRRGRGPRPGSGPVASDGRSAPAASSTWARLAPPKYGMHIRRRPVAGSSWTEWIGTMWVCWSRARSRGSSPSGRVTFRATGRLPRPDSSAR